jgi:hypothetical protein
MTCVSDRAFARSSTSRARAASSSAADGVGAGVGEVLAAGVGEAGVEGALGEPDGVGVADDDRPEGDAEGLEDGDGDAEATAGDDAAGLRAGEGEALPEGAGVIGGESDGDGVRSSALADTGKNATSATATRPPTHTDRSMSEKSARER